MPLGLRRALEKVRVDAGRVFREAQYVFTLTAKQVSLRRNPSGRLPVIAVIGNGTASDGPLKGQSVPQAVLLEVGIGSGRPYMRKHLFEKKRYTGMIEYRAKWFSLDSSQYRQVSRALFGVVHDIVREREYSRKRKKDGGAPRPFLLKRIRYFLAQRGLRWTFCREEHLIPSRFTVSFADTLLVADVLAGDVKMGANASYLLHAQKVIGAILANTDRRWSGVQPFHRTRAAAYIPQVLVPLPDHLKCEALVPFLKTGRFAEYLPALIGWDGKETLAQRIRGEAHLSDLPRRLKSVSVTVPDQQWDGNGYPRRVCGKGCLVFEARRGSPI